MEFVFVVPRSALFPDCYPHGFLPFGPGSGSQARSGRPEQEAPFSSSAFEETIAREGFFVERAWAERAPAFKQVIPYSIITCEGRVLLFRRLSTGGETRLHGKHSIGIGGHVNPEDLGGRAADARHSAVRAGTRREIAEELTVEGNYEVQAVGILNDDSNPVGAVHVGLVQVVHVHGSVEIREREQLEGRLVPCEELSTLQARGANFETWSRMLLPHLGELLNTPVALRSCP